jgi:hypothetical protein
MTTSYPLKKSRPSGVLVYLFFFVNNKILFCEVQNFYSVENMGKTEHRDFIYKFVSSTAIFDRNEPGRTLRKTNRHYELMSTSACYFLDRKTRGCEKLLKLI